MAANEMFSFPVPPSPIGTDLSAALAWTRTNVPANATLAVLPEGVMLNFLSGHINPTPCISWEPVIMNALGTSNMAAAFERNPPDYIYLVERDRFRIPGLGTLVHPDLAEK